MKYDAAHYEDLALHLAEALTDSELTSGLEDSVLLMNVTLAQVWATLAVAAAAEASQNITANITANKLGTTITPVSVAAAMRKAERGQA